MLHRLDVRADQARPEASPFGDLVADEGAEHVEAGVGEIQHAHHGEDQRQTAGHQEQQQAVKHAVQCGDQD